MPRRRLVLFIFSLIIPIFLASALTYAKLNFFSQAAATQNLRLWLEPASAIVSPGHTLRLALKANYDSATPLDFLSVSPLSPLAPVPSQLSASSLPSGDFTLGEFTVTAAVPGTYQILLPPSQIISSVKPDHLTTSPAEIIVR